MARGPSSAAALMAQRRWSFWMPAQDHGFIAWAMTAWRSWLTLPGRTVLIGFAMGSVFSAPGVDAAIYPVLSLALGLLAGGLVSGWFHRVRDLELIRRLPPPACAGEVVRYRVELVNRGRRPLRALSICEGWLRFGLHRVDEDAGGAADVDWLAPGERAEVTLALKAVERGAYELRPMRVGGSFPSGLIRVPRPVGPKQRLLVYPRFVSQREFELPVGLRYQPGGILVSAKLGGATEFAATREYRDGDRLRDIHWASFARSGRLIVKEYREEYFVRVGLLLDTQLARRQSAAALERRISIAAGIADALARRDYIIDLFAAGETLHRFTAGRALARLDNLLELLACVEGAPEVAFDVVEQRLLPHANRLSSVVLLLDDWDAPRARLCRLLRQSGAAVRPLVIRDRPPSEAPDADVVLLPTQGGPELLR